MGITGIGIHISPLKYVAVRIIAAMEPRMIMITVTEGITN